MVAIRDSHKKEEKAFLASNLGLKGKVKEGDCLINNKFS